MTSRLKYRLKIGIYKMKKFTAYFSTDVNDLIVRKKMFMFKVERVAGAGSFSWHKGMGPTISVE